ncbi:MAG: hypothetical protein ACNA8W_06880 [Bradymonadaceae bacterium]
MKPKHHALLLIFSLAATLVIWATPNTAEAFLFEVSGGMKGGFNGSAGPGISNGGRIHDQHGQTFTVENPEYYSHFGFGGSFGLVLELRALGFLGLETGLYYSRDNGQGWVDKNDAATGATLVTIHSEQTSTAYHFPILLRANIPNPLIRPFLGVGFEFVRQVNSTLEYRQEQVHGRYSDSDFAQIQNRYQITPSNYTLFLVSTGMELKFGPVRIPIEVRAGYNLGFDEGLESRATYDSDTNQIKYDGAYQGHFGIFTGFMYDFDFLL